MSRGAYEAHFGQAAPDGALFGVDVSWYQAATEYGPDWGVANGYWSDYGGWADFVCVRTSYGSGGDDGAQDLHFQVAGERGYGGPMGTYHFVYATSSTAANAANYLASSDRFVDRTSFDMLDFEAAPVASGGFVSELCDRIEQARQRPCLIYGGKSYLDQSGTISCPAEKLWVAQYAAAGSNAWVPTTDWSSWDAPLVPDQFAGQYPGVWQWSSFTPQHGHLDLNMSTTPAAFGGTASKELFTVSQYDDIMAAFGTLSVQMGQHVGGVYTRIGQAEDHLAKDGRKCRMVETSKGWFMTDFIGAVPLPSPDAVVAAQQMGFLNNDVDGNGNPIPQRISDVLFDTLVRYDLRVSTGPPVIDVEKSLKQATIAQLVEALKAALHDQTSADSPPPPAAQNQAAA